MIGDDDYFGRIIGKENKNIGVIEYDKGKIEYKINEEKNLLYIIRI